MDALTVKKLVLTDDNFRGSQMMWRQRLRVGLWDPSLGSAAIGQFRWWMRIFGKIDSGIQEKRGQLVTSTFRGISSRRISNPSARKE